MSDVLVVGLSHRTAPVSVLERAAVPGDDVRKTVDELHRAETISEVLLLSTCNRIEVYADVARFHPAVAEITSVLARHAGLAVSDLSDHLYVHFAEAAAEHMFTVASGLDSMVVGESQILGQLRGGLRAGHRGSARSAACCTTWPRPRCGSASGCTPRPASTAPARRSCRSRSTAPSRRPRLARPARRALIVGAGSMGALAGATLRRRGVTDIVVANRSPERAARLADRARRPRGAARPTSPTEIGSADLLISSTGSTGLVVEAELIGARAERVRSSCSTSRCRATSTRPSPCSPASPTSTSRRCAPAARWSATTRSAPRPRSSPTSCATTSPRSSGSPSPRPSPRCGPGPTRSSTPSWPGSTAGCPTSSPAERREVADAVRRAVEKVLHAPTVRVKELASTPGGDQYAAALRELFDLDPAAAESVAAVKQAEPVAADDRHPHPAHRHARAARWPAPRPTPSPRRSACPSRSSRSSPRATARRPR